MPSGSDAQIFLLDADYLEPFLKIPRQISASVWNQILSQQDISLCTETPAETERISIWAEHENPAEDADQILEQQEMLFDLMIASACKAQWRADIPQLLAQFINQGLPTQAALPETLILPWQSLENWLRREIHPLPPWLDQLYNPGGYYAALLNPEAFSKLQTDLLPKGLLAWIIEQFEKAESAKPQAGWQYHAEELKGLKSFLEKFSKESAYLLVTEPFG